MIMFLINISSVFCYTSILENIQRIWNQTIWKSTGKTMIFTFIKIHETVISVYFHKRHLIYVDVVFAAVQSDILRGTDDKVGK